MDSANMTLLRINKSQPDKVVSEEQVLPETDVHGLLGSSIPSTDASSYVSVVSLPSVLPLTAGEEETDELLAEHVLEPLGLPSLYNANTTPVLEREVLGSVEGGNARTALGNYLAEPSEDTKKAFIAAFQTIALKFPRGNILELLYVLFRESVASSVEDSKVYLNRLKSMNAEAEQLSKYLTELSTASARLEAARRTSENGDKPYVEVPVRVRFVVPTSSGGFTLQDRKSPSGMTIGADGKVTTEGYPPRYTTTSLGSEIKDVENKQDLLRNSRSMVNTQFQNTNERRNQSFKLMTDMMKSIIEGFGIGIRNFL